MFWDWSPSWISTRIRDPGLLFFFIFFKLWDRSFFSHYGPAASWIRESGSSIRMNEWKFLFPCDKKLDESQFSPGCIVMFYFLNCKIAHFWHFTTNSSPGSVSRTRIFLILSTLCDSVFLTFSGKSAFWILGLGSGNQNQFFNCKIFGYQRSYAL